MPAPFPFEHLTQLVGLNYQDTISARTEIVCARGYLVANYPSLCQPACTIQKPHVCVFKMTSATRGSF